jgi:hypothetical protein
MFEIAVFKICQGGPRDSNKHQGAALGRPGSTTALTLDKEKS